MTHTPGPWKIRKTGRITITGNVHQVTSMDDYPSAFVPAWDEPGDGEEDGTEEAKANARLIAAAPDLLQAAQEVYAWMNDLPIPTHGCVSKMQVLYNAVSKATHEPQEG